MPSIDSMGAYAQGTSKYLVSEKEETECNSVIKRYKERLTLTMSQKNLKEHNPNWQQIPDYSYRILIAGGSGPVNEIYFLIIS